MLLNLLTSWGDEYVSAHNPIVCLKSEIVYLKSPIVCLKIDVDYTDAAGIVS